MKLYSFDVFDTLLLRNEKSEAFRFFEIAGEVADFFNEKGVFITQQDVLIARYMATETTYRFSKKVYGCREGSLEEIYQGICSILNIDAQLWKEALQIEVEYEKDNVTFNFDLWKEIRQKALKEHAKMILISDIYMQAKYIEQLLVHHKPDFFDECDKLYSSADYTVSKASGHLFDIVCEDFDVFPQDCLHMGDNFTTDFKNPKARNWNADYLPIPDSRKKQIGENLMSFRNQLKSDDIVVPQIEKAVKGLLA